MTTTLRARHWACGLILGLALFPGPAQAAKVKIEIDGVKRNLERNIRSLLSLAQEDDDKLDEARIRRLHAKAPEEIGEALQPFGYYKPQVRSTLEHEGEKWVAHYTVEEGPAIQIASVDLRVDGEGTTDSGFQAIAAEFPVRRGEVLYHPDYESGKKELVDRAAEAGYLDAKFETSEVRVDLERYRADVVVHFQTGPRYRFGEVRFEQDVLDPELLVGYVTWKRGEPLDVNKVLALQNALSDSPYWSRVEVVTRQEEAQGLEVPIEVDLVPAKTMRFSGGVGYGTDTGPRVSGAWDLRRINRRGHRGVVSIKASAIEQSLETSYLIPGAFPRTDLLSFNTAYDRKDNDTTQSETGLIGAQRTQTRGGWREAISLNFQREDFTVGLDKGISNLVVPGISYERVKADDRIFTTRGYRLFGSLQGASASALSDSSFLQASIEGKAIRTVGDRNRLIGRAQVGYTVTDEFRELPPRFRFFAGGDRSVRGYAYQGLGELDSAGHVIGGETLLIGSLEYEFRLNDIRVFDKFSLDKFGLAAFYDAGNACHDFSCELEQGAGVGLRWLSPIGPIRADVAWALTEPGHPLRFHLSIGPDL
ncbi:MAG: autotransporter assembly complex family protein [Acidobacteriota bacterium]